jgi:hypothetical protein
MSMLMLTLALLSFVGVYPRTAQATPTLVIDHGGIHGIGTAGDTIYDFGGPDFSAEGAMTGATPSIFSTSFALALSPSRLFGPPGPGVTVFGIGECAPVPAGLPFDMQNCGRLFFTYDPIVIPPGATDLFTATVPFTATGFLNVGSPHAFDVVGRGTATFTICIVLTGPCQFDGFGGLSHDNSSFAFAEPTTLLLGVIGLSIAIIAARWRRANIG